MENDYNSNNFIRIIYGEASFEEYFQLDDAMEADPAIRVEFRELYDTFKGMPKATMAPSQQVIKNILDFNKRSLGKQMN